MSERSHPPAFESMAAASRADMFGFQPGEGQDQSGGVGGLLGHVGLSGGTGDSAVCEDTSDDETTDGPYGPEVPWVRHRTRGWRPDADGPGPAVPGGIQLTDEFIWEVAKDDQGSWWDVDRDWNAPLFAAVRNQAPLLRLAYRWWTARHKRMQEHYIVDFRNRRWTTQENEISGKRRAMRVVQVLNIIGAYRPPPPPPAGSPPTRVAVAPATVPQGL